jgi:hypothetical protein
MVNSDDREKAANRRDVRNSDEVGECYQQKDTRPYTKIQLQGGVIKNDAPCNARNEKDDERRTNKEILPVGLQMVIHYMVAATGTGKN